MRGRRISTRPLRRRIHPALMDAIAVMLAVVAFALLIGAIEALDRV
jgi:hypothetical protein